MGKDKKKNAKKAVPSNSLFDSAATAIKKYRRVTKQIGKLSTAQKVVGGAALLAAGLTYLAQQRAAGPAAAPAADAPPEAPATADKAGAKHKHLTKEPGAGAPAKSRARKDADIF